MIVCSCLDAGLTTAQINLIFGMHTFTYIGSDCAKGYMILTFEVIKGHFRSNKFLCQVNVNRNQGGGGFWKICTPANTTTTNTATTNTTTTTTIKTTTTTITTTITTTTWSYCSEVNIGCGKIELCKWTCIAVFNRHFQPIYDQKDFFGTPEGEFTSKEYI